MIIGTIVDWNALGETVLAALIAGIGVAVTVSMAILGATASVEASRDHKPLQSGAYAAMCLVGLLATGAAVVFGIIVMSTK